jgi:hypothetical protein
VVLRHDAMTTVRALSGIRIAAMRRTLNARR